MDTQRRASKPDRAKHGALMISLAAAVDDFTTVTQIAGPGTAAVSSVTAARRRPRQPKCTASMAVLSRRLAEAVVSEVKTSELRQAAPPQHQMTGFDLPRRWSTAARHPWSRVG